MDEVDTDNHQRRQEGDSLMIKREFLPFCRPLLGKEEEDAVLEVLRSGWLTTGPKTIQFEKDFAFFKGVEHAVAVNSCTSALHLALVALGVGQGDEVIVSPITWPSTINTIINMGAVPVFVDVDKETLNMDSSRIDKNVTRLTKAVQVVHMAGNPADMDEINAIALSHGIPVIEDAAHALEAVYKGRQTGSLGAISCFSLYPTKSITACEGGMLVTGSKTIADTVRTLSFNGIDRDAWKRYGSEGYKHWEVVTPGYKYNMPDILAAIGIQQLRKVWPFWSIRKRYSDMYDAALADIPEIRLLTKKSYVLHSYHLYIIVLDTDRLTVDRDAVLNAIQAEGVGVGVHFRALHLQQGYRSLGYEKGDLPSAEYMSDRIISLPLYPSMSVEDVEYVIEVVKKVITRYRKG